VATPQYHHLLRERERERERTESIERAREKERERGALLMLSCTVPVQCPYSPRTVPVQCPLEKTAVPVHFISFKRGQLNLSNFVT